MPLDGDDGKMSFFGNGLRGHATVQHLFGNEIGLAFLLFLFFFGFFRHGAEVNGVRSFSEELKNDVKDFCAIRSHALDAHAFNFLQGLHGDRLLLGDEFQRFVGDDGIEYRVEFVGFLQAPRT